MTRFLLSISLLSLSSAALAVPLSFSHQGRLLDSTGAPLDAPDSLTLRLYDAPSGGNVLWEETHSSVDFDAGYFSVEVGSQSTLDADVFDGSLRYLGVTVGAGTELSDRLALLSVPYAVRAGQADLADEAVMAQELAAGTVVDASEVRIGGTTVIDSSGSIATDALGNVSDTLSELGCGAGEQPVFDGSAWVCGSYQHSADDITSGTVALQRLPTGTSADAVALGNHTHSAADVGALPDTTTATDIGALPDTTTAADIGALPDTTTAADVGALPDTTTAADIGALPIGGGTLSGALTVDGAVTVGDNNDDCESTNAGAIRWNGTEFQGCTGEVWARLGGKSLGDNRNNPGLSCLSIKQLTPSAPDGVYWIDPTESSPFEAYCDMTTSGGGWTLVLHSYYRGSLPLSTDLQVDTNTRRTTHIGDVADYDGINTDTLIFMAMDPFKALADNGSALRFESDNFPTHSVLNDFSMNSAFSLDGSNESTIRSEMCGGSANCFIDARGLSTIGNDQDNWSGACWNNNYHQQAWWYDDCFSYNPFWTSGNSHFSNYSSKDNGTRHWSWWVR